MMKPRRTETGANIDAAMMRRALHALENEPRREWCIAVGPKAYAWYVDVFSPDLLVDVPLVPEVPHDA